MLSEYGFYNEMENLKKYHFFKNSNTFLSSFKTRCICERKLVINKCTKLQVDIVKRLSFGILNVKKANVYAVPVDLGTFPIFIFFSDLGRQKSALGSYSRSF